MPTFSDFLYGALYQKPCRFANIDRFIEAVSVGVDLDAQIDASIARERLQSIASSLHVTTTIHSEDEAARELAGRDLDMILSTDLAEIASWESVTQRLNQQSPAVQQRLIEAGLPVAESPLRIVDEFPKPFNRFAWSAFAPDREDEERFDIEPGVYFRSDRLRPLYSEALFAHEVIHTVTGRVDPEVYAMGLEEGIAEVLGTCYGALAVVPAAAIRNILVYGRHGANRDKLWSVYLDHTRQAFLLYQEFGIDGLVELVRRGRAAIHNAEELVATGEYQGLQLPRGNWDEQTSSLLQFVCCGYLPSHVFSPLECLLAMNAEAGLTLDDICSRAGVAPEVGKAVLEKLGAKSALFVQDGERIGYSNVGRYLALEAASGISVIRYLPKMG